MKVLRCQVRLTKVVQIDIPEDKLGDQLPENLAELTARSQYGYEFSAEAELVERVWVADTSNSDGEWKTAPTSPLR